MNARARVVSVVGAVHFVVVTSQTICLNYEMLPVLTSQNKHLYQEWHAYFERVYNERVIEDVDLNTFNWFYWFCPDDVHKPVKQKRPANNLLNVLTPDTNLNELGFFINVKTHIDSNTIRKKGRIEVLRVSDLELFVAWFYVSKGSGIYVDIPETYRIWIGRKKEFMNYDCWMKHTGGNCNDIVIHKGLTNRNVDLALLSKVSSNIEQFELVLSRPRQLGICGACVGQITYSSGYTTHIPVSCTDYYHVVLGLICLLLIINIVIYTAKLQTFHIIQIHTVSTFLLWLLVYHRPKFATYKL